LVNGFVLEPQERRGDVPLKEDLSQPAEEVGLGVQQTEPQYGQGQY
jgi:hypothetical protein